MPTSPADPGDARVEPGVDVAADTLYVAPDGDDDAAGTMDAPWATLETALSRLEAGDTLEVRGGTYDEDVEPELAPGTPIQRITVRAHRGERAVVKGLVRLTRPDYWTVEDLEFTWGGGSFNDHMVKVSGGTGWILDGVRIHGSRSRAGLLIASSGQYGPPRDYVLRNSAVYDSKKGANLYLNPGLDSRGGLIERNLFFDSPTENVKVGFGGGCDDQRDDEFGAADVVVRYNTLSDAEQPLTIAEPATRIDAYRNLITDSRGDALVRIDGECGNLRPPVTLHDNLGDGADQWCEDGDSPLTCADADTGGNVFPVDPDFDSTRLDGFHPRDERAQDFGRYAPR